MNTEKELIENKIIKKAGLEKGIPLDIIEKKGLKGIFKNIIHQTLKEKGLIRAEDEIKFLESIRRFYDKELEDEETLRRIICKIDMKIYELLEKLGEK